MFIEFRTVKNLFISKGDIFIPFCYKFIQVTARKNWLQLDCYCKTSNGAIFMPQWSTKIVRLETVNERCSFLNSGSRASFNHFPPPLSLSPSLNCRPFSFPHSRKAALIADKESVTLLKLPQPSGFGRSPVVKHFCLTKNPIAGDKPAHKNPNNENRT